MGERSQGGKASARASTKGTSVGPGKEESRLFQLAFDYTPAILVVVDLEKGTVRGCNRAALHLAGRSREQVLGQPLADLFFSDSAELVKELLGELRSHTGGSLLKHRLLQGGQELELTLQRLPAEGVEPSVVASWHDVTLYTQVEEALRESEARMRALVEGSSDILWEVDARGVYTYCSPNVSAILGYEPEELLGKTPFDFMPEQEAARVGALFEEIVSQRRPFSLLAHTIRYKDGRTGVLECSGQPIFDPQGDLKGYRGVDRDITERVRAEEALALSRERYRTLAENAVDIIFTLDLEGNLTSINRVGETLSGYPADEIVGKNVVGLLSAADAARVKEKIREAVAAGPGSESVTLELEITDRNQRRVVLEVNARGVWQRDRPVEVEGIARDITRRRELEEQLQHAQKMESVGRLAGGVAHDFNNLLTGILGYTDLLLRRVEKGGLLHGELQRVRELAYRAAELTQQLLAFSRRQPLRPRILNLEGLVERTGQMLRRMIGEDIDLEIRKDSSSSLVRADPGQLEQVLMNLAVNARDAMPEGGRLQITISNVDTLPGRAGAGPEAGPGPYVLLSISDTGSGMDEPTRRQIFDPFFTTKELGKGTGLGLSTVYGIIRQHGGYITVESEIGKGSVFQIYLPQVDEQEEEASAESAPDQGVARLFAGHETILVVEDEPRVRDLVERCLRSHGYHVLCTSHPSEAEEIFKDSGRRVDLLLADVVLPGRSGPELYRRLSSLRGGLKVLYMSGYVGRHLETAPPSPFLAKPFTPLELVRQVRSVLDQP